MTTRRSKTRIEYGDWQTPAALAQGVLSTLSDLGLEPASLLEPTCGTGAFLTAGARVFPNARQLAFDINDEYVARARENMREVGQTLPTIERADFFTQDWESVLSSLAEPVLIVGNPPWVTNSALGVIASQNLPLKQNFKRLTGLDARTGKSNFDVSEWMMLRLLSAAVGRRFLLAMLCKSAVARKIMEHGAAQGWPLAGRTYKIDAMSHFGAAVDAVLMVVEPLAEQNKLNCGWPIFDSLSAKSPSHIMGVVGGRTYSDLACYERTRDLEGHAHIEWRSGVKHDCSKIMEFQVGPRGLLNGLGEEVDIEPTFVFPLLKGSDLANGRGPGTRCVLVPQRELGSDTRILKRIAPRTWAYLAHHRDLLDNRKSSIYRGRPPFSVFGVGDYAFAKHKVAICGLYKRLNFRVVGPSDGRPVMLDDTCYFLPCNSECEATSLKHALDSTRARAFFEARIFWDAKRPINKALLQGLRLEALVESNESAPARRRMAAQQVLPLV